jgi:hypothetical protein
MHIECPAHGYHEAVEKQCARCLVFELHAEIAAQQCGLDKYIETIAGMEAEKAQVKALVIKLMRAERQDEYSGKYLGEMTDALAEVFGVINEP